MANKKTPRTKKQTKAPRTNISWGSASEYAEATAAAGTVPLATHVRDVYLRSIRSNGK